MCVLIFKERRKNQSDHFLKTVSRNTQSQQTNGVPCRAIKTNELLQPGRANLPVKIKSQPSGVNI
jgi:hypothetical protein